MSTLGDLLAEHTDPARQRRRPPARRGRGVAAARRPVVRRLPDVGAPRRRRAGVRRAGPAEHRADGAAGRRRRHRSTTADEMPVGRPPRSSPAHIGRESDAGQADSRRPLAQRRGRPRPPRQRRGRRADPSDRAGRPAQGQPAGDAPIWTARATCCTCCPKAPSPTSATWRCRGPARGSATGSSGSTSTGGVVFASPNAISAYHRMGLTAELEGHNLVTVTRPLISRPVRGAGTGQPRPRLAGRRVQHADGGRRRRSGRAAAHAAAGGARRGRRRGGADPRRHRGQAPRPRAAVQGRDDPRDPPPGEEQPADRRRAAAAAGPAHQQRRGPRGADRVGAAGVVDRAGARRAVDVGRRGGQPRRGRRPDPADHERRCVGRTPRSASTGSATSACSTPTGPPR